MVKRRLLVAEGGTVRAGDRVGARNDVTSRLGKKPRFLAERGQQVSCNIRTFRVEVGGDVGLHRRPPKEAQVLHVLTVQGRQGRQARDSIPAPVGTVLPGACQLILKDRERLLHCAHGEFICLTCVAGLGGLWLADGPRNFQSGGGTYTHVDHQQIGGQRGWCAALTRQSSGGHGLCSTGGAGENVVIVL